MSYQQVDEDQDLFTYFPKAAELLPVWLKDLGTVAVHRLHPNYPDIWVDVDVEFAQPANVVKESVGKRTPGRLWANKYTGAICEVCGNASFLGEPPENGDTEIHLRVNLELSTRYLPKERYTNEELAAVMSRFGTKFQTGVTW